MLPDKLFARSITPRLRRRTISSTPRDNSTQSIKNTQRRKEHRLCGPPHQIEHQMTDDEIILYKGKSYIPPDIDLRRNIIQEYHSSPISGHPEFFKTLVLLKRHECPQWLNNLQTTVQHTHPIAAPLMPIKSHAHRPFQQITNGFNHQFTA